MKTETKKISLAELFDMVKAGKLEQAHDYIDASGAIDSRDDAAKKKYATGDLVIVQSDIKFSGGKLWECGESTLGIVRQINEETGMALLDTPTQFGDQFFVKLCRIRPITGNGIRRFLTKAADRLGNNNSN